MQLCSQGFLSTHFYFSKLLKKLGNKSDTMSEEQGWVRENPSKNVKIDAGFSITRERRPTRRKKQFNLICPNIQIQSLTHFLKELVKTSLGPGSAVGGKRPKRKGSNRKNIGERSKPSGILVRGEARPPFPLGSLRSSILFFSPSPTFSPFSHNAEPGPRLG